MPGWARRIDFPLKGRSSAGHPGQSRDRAWEGKREDGEEDTGASCRRAHAAVCAKGGGRHQEPNPLFQVLPEAADGEGHDRKNRSGQSEIAQTGVQAGMSYYINNTMSIDSDPFCPWSNCSGKEESSFKAALDVEQCYWGICWSANLLTIPDDFMKD